MLMLYWKLLFVFVKIINLKRYFVALKALIIRQAYLTKANSLIKAFQIEQANEFCSKHKDMLQSDKNIKSKVSSAVGLLISFR